MQFSPRASSLMLFMASGAAQAGGLQAPAATQLDEVKVTASAVETNAGSDSLSASQGVVTAEQLENRPRLRTAELLEAVPGLIVTQHSGDGKANQYFLRGFNLDHGTDFRTTVAGIPVNMPTHAHGQGYTDLNFVIPELVETIRYQKGPYDAADGDFATAGSARLEFFHALPQGFAQFEAGENDYQRLVAESRQQQQYAYEQYAEEYDSEEREQGESLIPDFGRLLFFTYL